MAADGQAVTISELAAPRRVVTFAGRDLPEKGLVVAGEQRSVQSHYPGTQMASVQVLGTKEDPIVLTGWFQDEIVSDPTAQIRLLRGIMQGGSLCRLVWGDVISRVGRVKRCEFPFHEEKRVRYSVTFEVDQADEAIAMKPIPVRSVQVLGDLELQLDDVRTKGSEALTTARTILALSGIVR